MKLIDITCPSCRATMKFHDSSHEICCEFCGKTFILEETSEDDLQKQEEFVMVSDTNVEFTKPFQRMYLDDLDQKSHYMS